jgi:hypothetical protein
VALADIMNFDSTRVQSEPSEDSYLAEFCEKTGIRFFFHADCLWQSMGMKLYVPTPSCFSISFSPDELDLMWQEGAWFIQHPVHDHEEGFASYVFFLDDKNYDFASIKSSDRRHNIRRGLKHCAVDRVSFQMLEREAPRLIADTYKRQGRNCEDNVLKMWNDYLVAAGSNPLFRAWGAFVGKELAAAKIEFMFRGGIHPEALFSRSDLLKYYTMNALLFVSTKETMRMENVSYISHGLRPVTGEKESLVDFKESVGLQKVPVKERLEVNPRVKLLLNRLSCRCGSFIPQRICERSEYARLSKGILMTLAKQFQNS